MLYPWLPTSVGATKPKQNHNDKRTREWSRVPFLVLYVCTLRDSSYSQCLSEKLTFTRVCYNKQRNPFCPLASKLKNPAHKRAKFSPQVPQVLSHFSHLKERIWFHFSLCRETFIRVLRLIPKFKMRLCLSVVVGIKRKEPKRGNKEKNEGSHGTFCACLCKGTVVLSHWMIWGFCVLRKDMST